MKNIFFCLICFIQFSSLAQIQGKSLDQLKIKSRPYLAQKSSLKTQKQEQEPPRMVVLKLLIYPNYRIRLFLELLVIFLTLWL